MSKGSVVRHDYYLNYTEIHGHSLRSGVWGAGSSVQMRQITWVSEELSAGAPLLSTWQNLCVYVLGRCAYIDLVNNQVSV